MSEENSIEINPENNKRKPVLLIVLSFFIVLLLVSNLLTLYFLFYKGKGIANKPNTGTEETDGLEVLLPEDNIATSAAENNNENNEVINEENIENTTPENLPAGSISVSWTEWPVIKTPWTMFDYNSVKEAVDNFNKENEYNQLEVDSFVNTHKVYKVGQIDKGEYIGKEIFIITFRPEGPAFRDEMYRIIKNDSELVLLANYSDRTWGIYDNLFLKNDNIIVDNLETPEFIKIPNSEIEFIKSSQEPMMLIDTLEETKKLFEYDKNKYLYQTDKNCYVARAADGTYREYHFKIDFLEKNAYTGSAPNSWEIIWTDGDETTHEFTFRGQNGCGAGPCYNYIDSVKAADLLEIGKTGTGDSIYEYKDKNSKNYRDFYDEVSGYNINDAINYEDFIESKQLVYWQDPFGNFLELRNAKYQPMAECGKPVIYLYPEEETDALVRVAPTGGFKITEPNYDSGWKVKASPDGALYNYDDKKEYPYLFWEGYGLDYARPEQGFVVKRENIKTFLEEKLSALGLIKKEYDEFIEFWLPRMQEKPYYFITFVPKEEFDKLAPLSVYPAPDTVIRVFMDFEGLDEYRYVMPQSIATPERIGFTVVEWGGALHK